MKEKEDFIVNIPARATGEDTLNTMLKHMEDIGGSDLFLLGGSEAWVSRYNKKIKVTRRRLTDKEVYLIISDVYGSNAPSKLGTGYPIDTSHEFKLKDSILPEIEYETASTRHRFRVNAVSCLRNGRQSITITFRTIPTTPPSTNDIRVEDEIVEVCRSSDQGLVLVVGATGNGKSTLLASILRDQLEDPEGHKNLVTIESPIEFVYDDIVKPTSFITQLEVGRHIPSFHQGVENSLRMAPTTILIGESRDYETVNASLEASVTGHVVFSTVHANSVAETFQRLISVFPEEMKLQAKYDLVQAMKLIVAQRLINTVDGKRTAIREFLIFNQDIKNYIIEAPNMAIAVFEMVELYGKPMMADVYNKLKEGIISQEVYDRQAMNYKIDKTKGEEDASK